MLYSKFKRDIPDILYDGIIDPEKAGENGLLPQEEGICIRNNGEARFAFLDAKHNFKNISFELAPYDCEHAPLKAPAISSAK
jgi:hypothetical protein